MSEVSITRNNASFEDAHQFIKLLAEDGAVQVMLQSVVPDSVLWIEPAGKPGVFEFFYILSGSLILHTSKGEEYLNQNDSFYVENLSKTVRLSSKEHTKLLYVANMPMYDALADFNGDFQELADRVEEKDIYTRGHGKRVMHYAIAIAEKLGLGSISTENLVVASLFHDVGKCCMPDEILKKAGSLTREELRLVVRHPVDTRKLLEPKFGKDVAIIAQSHHERMDGSGYPYGLKGGELSIEARIIAVADSFDAITSARTYNKPRSFEDAADELCGLSRQYDKNVTGALRELIENKKIAREKEMDDTI